MSGPQQVPDPAQQPAERLVIIDQSVARFFDRWLRLHGYLETAEPYPLESGEVVEVTRIHVPGRRSAC